VMRLLFRLQHAHLCDTLLPGLQLLLIASSMHMCMLQGCHACTSISGSTCFSCIPKGHSSRGSNSSNCDKLQQCRCVGE
jgi:hypothetical protein